MGVSLEATPVIQNHSLTSQALNMETDQRDIESELSKLLGEDGVSEVMTDIFQ